MKSTVMKKAWELKKKSELSFGECLKRAWATVKLNSKRFSEAKEQAGITEEVHTWYGWKELGYMVSHGSKNLFQVSLMNLVKGKEYKASYFGASQVEILA